MDPRITLEVKTPRTGEETPEAMVQFLASIASIKPKRYNLIYFTSPVIALEIALIDQNIHFYINIPQSFQSFIESQITSQYPKATVSVSKGDLVRETFTPEIPMDTGRMMLTNNHVYPLKTIAEFKDVDPLSSLMGLLAKLDREDSVLVQFMLVPIRTDWQHHAQRSIEQKPGKDESDPLMLSIYSKQVSEKINYPGLKVGIRIITRTQNPSLLDMVAASFLSYNKVNGNSLSLQKPFFWQKKKFLDAILERTTDYVSKDMILNVMELATMYHYPTEKLSTIQNIQWSKTILSGAPENLPVALDLTEEKKQEINFFAKTEYKNKTTTFGIYKEDRRKHMYIIGKTGTGKSTFIANMAINDIRNGEGMAIVDPHGDLVNAILEYIPSYRVNDVVLMDPSDMQNPFHINPLEIDSSAQKELVASGIVGIFYKLYGTSWGPRLEYTLRNTLLTLTEVPNATLLMVTEMLTNAKFRKEVIAQIKDPVMKNYWLNEFETMPPKQREEAVAPILNKVGQFVSSPVIRPIIQSPKSTINLEKCMNEGKIVLLNLSQGKIGEDNSALLGAMMITKLQLAAMNRVYIPETERRDFFLYVDEFQNFATSSFIKILSEARKYRLCLTLANQYIGQISEEIRLAIFGNAGTMVSFIVGAGDAPYLAKEFSERFKEEDLLSLANHQIIIKETINGLTSPPFMAFTLPPPLSKTQNKEKVIKISRERYNRKDDLPVNPFDLGPAKSAETQTDSTSQAPQSDRRQDGRPTDDRRDGPRQDGKPQYQGDRQDGRPHHSQNQPHNDRQGERPQQHHNNRKPDEQHPNNQNQSHHNPNPPVILSDQREGSLANASNDLNQLRDSSQSALNDKIQTYQKVDRHSDTAETPNQPNPQDRPNNNNFRNHHGKHQKPQHNSPRETVEPR
jgi:hypothetical protein